MTRENLIINLHKPPGITSHKAAKRVQKILGAFRTGHTGTLDPFAEGVLLVCLNNATRIAEYLSGLDKEYIVYFRFGITTDTYDITGSVIREVRDPGVSEDDLRKTITSFIGEIDQEPPMYSAIKVEGTPLYKLARKGISIERKRRKVFIQSIDLIEYSPPNVTIRSRCSKGTYIRTLVHDIGESLGVGATVTALKRTSVGGFRIEDSTRFEDLKDGRFRPYTMDEAIQHLGEIILDGIQCSYALRGRGFYIKETQISWFKDTASDQTILMEDTVSTIRLKDPSWKLIGIGRLHKDGFVRIEKIFSS